MVEQGRNHRGVTGGGRSLKRTAARRARMAGSALVACVALAAASATAQPANRQSQGNAPRAAAPQGEVCGENLVIQQSMQLKPGCRYTGTTIIAASNVTLDCQGATLDAAAEKVFTLVVGGRRAVTDVEVKNCVVTGSRRHGVFVGLTALDTRKPLGADGRPDYDQHPRRVVLRNVSAVRNANVGIYVDDYVQDVQILDSLAEGNASTGIYLEHSSRNNRIINTRVVNNGFGTASGVTGALNTSREGIAVDSSAGNVIENNVITGNKAGGIFLYRNCGERPDMEQSVLRWQPSSGNTIRGNTVEGGRVGIWVASRQEMVLRPEKCQLRADPANGVFPDAAPDNTVTGNTIRNVEVGIRVADDGNVIEDNQVAATGDCLMLGSGQRDRMRRPVQNLTIRANACEGRPVNLLPRTGLVRDNGPMTR